MRTYQPVGILIQVRPRDQKESAKEKLLKVALSVIREKGYSATTVDELCAAARVTKGAFFHHFKSKEELAVEAANFWSKWTGDFFAGASYHHHKDPLDRVLGYVDFRKEILKGKTPEFTCLVGTMVQEMYNTSPSIRAACEESIFGHAEKIAKDVDEAIRLHNPELPFTGGSLALHIQAVIQGAFILAKASDNAAVAAESLSHLRHYIELCFPRRNAKGKQ